MKATGRIPKNYYSFKKKYLGYFTAWQGIEALAGAFGGFFIFSLSLGRLPYGHLIALALALFTAGGLGIIQYVNDMALHEILMRDIRFLLGRKTLTYRKIRRHVKGKGKSGKTEKGREKAEKVMEKAKSSRLYSELFSTDGEGGGKTPSSKMHYTQEIVSVKRIVNAGGFVMVEKKDGTFVKIVEVGGRDFQALDDEKKSIYIGRWQAFLRDAPEAFQVKIRTTNPDMSPYKYRMDMNALKYRYTDVMRQLSGEIKDYITIQSANAQVRRYLLIMPYTPKTSGESAVREARDVLSEYYENARACLSPERADLKLDFISYGSAEEETEAVKSILYEHYNHPEYNTASEDYIRNMETMDIREEKVWSLTRAADRNAERFSVHHVLAPKDLTCKSRDFCDSNGMCSKTMFLTDIPRSLPAGWILSLINSVASYIEIDLFVRRVKTDEIYNLKLQDARTKLNSALNNSFNAVEREEILETDEDVQYIQENLKHSPVWDFAVMFTIHAHSLEVLRRFTGELDKLVRSFGFKLDSAVCCQEEGYRASAPLWDIPDFLFKQHRRNVLSDGAATLYPFLTDSSVKDHGIVYGYRTSDDGLYMLDVFSPRPVNVLVFGKPGYGKSFSTMLQATRMRLDGAQVIIVSPTKGHEYKRLCTELNGAYLPFGPSYSARINLMELRPEADPNADYLDESDRFAEKSILEGKIEELSNFFTLAFPQLTADTAEALAPALRSFYGELGFTNENSSIYVNGDPDTKEIRPMPVISDFVAYLRKRGSETEDYLAERIENKFVKGNFSHFNAQSNVNLLSDFIAVDLTSAFSDGNESEKAVLTVALVESLIKSRVKSNTLTRKVIVFEEMWMFLQNPDMADIIEEFWRSARGYRGACFGITQTIGEMDRNLQSQTILRASETEIIFNSDPSEVQNVVRNWNVPYDTAAVIRNLERGNCLVLSKNGTERTGVRVDVTDTEKRLFNTDPETEEKAKLAGAD